MSEAYMVRLDDGRMYGPASMDVLLRWATEGRLRPEAMLIPQDGSPPLAARDEPRLAPHVLAPPTVAGPLARPVDNSTLAVVVPYRNAPALTGYYVSVLSLVPGLGLLAGPAALGLGIAGLRRARRDPTSHGAVHAWIAVVLGGLTGVANLAIAAWLLAASLG